jgi:hypothetical protein
MWGKVVGAAQHASLVTGSQRSVIRDSDRLACHVTVNGGTRQTDAAPAA